MRRLPFIATSFGTWWGNDVKAKVQSDIDIIAANRKNKEIILGECKWKNSIDDVSGVNKLKNKEHLLPDYKDRSYFIFSKAPYSDHARKLEKMDRNLYLITLDMLFEEVNVNA